MIKLVQIYLFYSSKRLLSIGAVIGIAVILLLNSLNVTAAGVDYNAHSYTDRVVARTYITVFGRSIDATAREYWYPRALEKASASWFAAAVMNSNEYRHGLGKLNDKDFINTVYKRAAGRNATANEQIIWQAAFKNKSQNRSTMVGWSTENLYTYKLTKPKAVGNCRQYNKGGSIIPLCDAGSAGHQKNVSIVRVPDTTIYVNRIWYYEMDTFVKLAKKNGYTLDAYRSKYTPSWMLSPGSWRSWDEQNYLYTHINPETGKPYPANPPGKSMHEWGLAVDFSCNGKTIEDVPACWRWVRANGGKYGIHNFRTVDSIDDSEAWHFSSNGL